MAAEPQPSATDPNVEAYNAQRTQLEAEHYGQYIAFTNGHIVGLYPELEAAWQAVAQEPDKLVLRVGDEPLLSPLRVSQTMRDLGHLRTSSRRKLGNVGR